MAAQGIKKQGYVLAFPRHNNNGEVVTTEKLNPAFKFQREAMSAMRSLQRQADSPLSGSELPFDFVQKLWLIGSEPNN